MTAATSVPPPRTGPSGTWRYRPELDGLRTLAVVAVVFFHAQVSTASGSFIGVDLFFVLSGFLVTNVVLSEIDDTGEFRLGRFYARRVRRLLPAAVVTIVVTCVVFVMVASQPERLALVRQAQAALVYVANWQFLADGADYFAGDVRSSPFLHFWSLSIEEQYYIAFPLLVLLWWRCTGGRGRVLLAGLGVLTLLSVASQVYWGQVDPTRAYFATDARLFQLLAGAVLAVALRELATPHPDGGVRWQRAGQLLALGGVVGLVVLGSDLVGMSHSHRSLLATVVAGALVLGTYTAPGSAVARFLALPWLTYLGRTSYGIYLWHYPVMLVVARVLDVRPLLIAVITLVGAVALASMSYQLLETPLRRGRVLDPFPWQSVVAGVAVSVVAAALVVGPVLRSDRQPSLVAEVGSAESSGAAAAAPAPVSRKLEREIPKNLDFEQLKNDRGPADTYCTPGSPEDCLVVDGDGPHVVVVGDSHARMLSGAFERLAREEGFKLSLSVTTGCPWPDGLYNDRLGRTAKRTCLAARRGFYDRTLPTMDPDVVVLVNLARSSSDWEGDVLPITGRRRPLNEMQQAAVDRTVRRVESAGARAIMVKSIMGTEGFDDGGFDPLDCLARAGRQKHCTIAAPLARPVADALYESAAVGDDAATTIDLNPVFCPDAPACRPILDGVVVWRDPRHLTSRIAIHLRREIWAAVRDTGLVDG